MRLHTLTRSPDDSHIHLSLTNTATRGPNGDGLHILRTEFRGTVEGLELMILL